MTKIEEYCQQVLDKLWEQSEEVEGEPIWTGAFTTLVKEVAPSAVYISVSNPLLQSKAIIMVVTGHRNIPSVIHLVRRDFKFHDDGTPVDFTKKDWGKTTPAQVRAQREQDVNRRLNRLERQMEQVLAILTARGIVEAYDEAADEAAEEEPEEDLLALLVTETEESDQPYQNGDEGEL